MADFDPMPPARELQFPLYVKAPLVLLGLALLVFALHIASEIIFPLFFAAIFAIMLHPVERWLIRKRVPQLLAIALTVVLGVAAVVGLVYFISVEAAQLSDQMPMFKKKLADTTAQVHEWLQNRFGLSDQKLQGWVSEAGTKAQGLLGGTLSAVSGLLVTFTLIPVYIFLLFLYQKRLVDFLVQAFSGRQRDSGVSEVLRESKTAIQSYMVGLLIEGSIVAALNVTVLLIIGVPYALLLGVMGALLNFIPYIGGLIAIALPMLMAFVANPGYGHAIEVKLVARSRARGERDARGRRARAGQRWGRRHGVNRDGLGTAGRAAAGHAISHGVGAGSR